MEDYDQVQIARRVTRLIHDTEYTQFPLIGCMIIILILAIIGVAIKAGISAVF